MSPPGEAAIGFGNDIGDWRITLWLGVALTAIGLLFGYLFWRLEAQQDIGVPTFQD